MKTPDQPAKGGHRDCIKFILPISLCILLFSVSFFLIFLPSFQDSLLDRKKETSRELTMTALHVLTHFAGRAQAGEFPIAEAQERALALIRSLRYGPENKDYFWINDLRPYMIMHPYRSDLEGRDLSSYKDPNGKALFVDFVEVARRDGSGYVPYIWQWKDVPARMEPKLSYVHLFEPWGWVIGTGVYLEDVQEEVAAVTRRVSLFILGALAVFLALSFYLARHGMHTAEGRWLAEQELRQYQGHLEELVCHRTAELQKALSEVKQLSGLLPICASCKKIRDDGGYWQQIEVYIRDRSGADFSHGICPDCARKLYPEIFG